MKIVLNGEIKNIYLKILFFKELKNIFHPLKNLKNIKNRISALAEQHKTKKDLIPMLCTLDTKIQPSFETTLLWVTCYLKVPLKWSADQLQV